MEKASFNQLNKLFMITSNERNHQTLLSTRNLLVVIQEPQPYVLPIIPRRLPKVVVPREHHVLKDLPFYEEAHEADAKAHQVHLNQREEKRQKGKLRKARGEKGPVSSSTNRHPAKKKKPSAKAFKVLTMVPDSPSVSTSSASTSTDSFVPDSGGDLDPLRFERSDLNPRSFESELMIPEIIHEPEVEEDMVTDLRAGFRERQRKWLFEPIEVVAPPARRRFMKSLS